LLQHVVAVQALVLALIRVALTVVELHQRHEWFARRFGFQT
jgi:hypothetical protein